MLTTLDLPVVTQHSAHVGTSGIHGKKRYNDVYIFSISRIYVIKLSTMLLRKVKLLKIDLRRYVKGVLPFSFCIALYREFRTSANPNAPIAIYNERYHTFSGLSLVRKEVRTATKVASSPCEAANASKDRPLNPRRVSSVSTFSPGYRETIIWPGKQSTSSLGLPFEDRISRMEFGTIIARQTASPSASKYMLSTH